jgi:NAD+ synthase (glutamine-hydrolysing)
VIAGEVALLVVDLLEEVDVEHDQPEGVAVALGAGHLLAIVPKAYLPNYREFEEARWFRPGIEVLPAATHDLLGETVPFGTDILLCSKRSPDLIVGIELCEDMWVHLPPSVRQISAGATVICNLSASNFTIGKAELRRLLARSASDRGKCAYIYVAAGPGESSTDLAFDADAFVCENGHEVASSKRFSRENQLVTVDIDLELLIRERLATNSLGDCARQSQRPFRRIPFALTTDRRHVGKLKRDVPAQPFLPRDPQTLSTRCWEIFEIQTNALATRMLALDRPSLVLGLSGGLDSTHAALVGAAALDQLGRSRSDLRCVTLPGLGTSVGTRTNAEALAGALGATFQEIGISEASRVILAAIGHESITADTRSVEQLIKGLRQNPELGDVTLENVQARLRTLVVFALANQHAGHVLGTGDLSEKALGWCTYAGDHIANYDINGGVPKTLIQFVIRWVADHRVDSWAQSNSTPLKEVLHAILDTPISPELLPTGLDGSIAQITEQAIGPYELHDFYLYHFVRHGARPGRVLDLARVAFGERYPLEELQRWLAVFLRRFFASQFKRSCATDGPKVGMVSLSPRGDWRMPSDAQVRSWIEEVENYQK